MNSDSGTAGGIDTGAAEGGVADTGNVGVGGSAGTTTGDARVDDGIRVWVPIVEGSDRVRMTGVRGHPRPAPLKALA